MEGTIFWDEDYKGKCKGGFFIRNNLFKSIEKFKEKGYRVIGIKVGDGWNLEFICKEPKVIQKGENGN